MARRSRILPGVLLIAASVVTDVRAQGEPGPAPVPAEAAAKQPPAAVAPESMIDRLEAALAPALHEIEQHVQKLDDQIAAAQIKERLIALEKVLGDAAALARHLARRVEYVPGSPDIADRIPIQGPFVPGQTYRVVRHEANVVERYTVLEIYGNGWIKVKPLTKTCPFADAPDVWLNTAQVVLVAGDR